MIKSDSKKQPRVLVISHNCFSPNTNMGKTLESFFSCWQSDNIAQLYFREDVPVDETASTYYKISDMDALKSIIMRWKCGHVIKQKKATNLLPNRKYISELYNYGTKKKPIVCLARDLMWKCSAWCNKGLLEWVDSFKPDVIFFASGDYAFSYKIAMKIASIRKIPLIICCFDDFYINCRNRESWLGRLHHNYFMKIVKKCINKTSAIFTTNPLMSKKYSEMFDKECPILYTATSIIPSTVPYNMRNAIVYLGGTGLNRHIPLFEIGKTLKALRIDGLPDHIDVYTKISDNSLLEYLNEKNGVIIHDPVSYNEVTEIISKSLAVVHVESSDSQSKRRVMYSLSTKIPDCLASGVTFIAYGPAETASIQYLLDNNAALVITEKNELESKLREIVENQEKIEEKIRNGISLASRNHNQSSIDSFFYKKVCSVIREWNNKKIVH